MQYCLIARWYKSANYTDLLSNTLNEKAAASLEQLVYSIYWIGVICSGTWAQFKFILISPQGAKTKACAETNEKNKN